MKQLFTVVSDDEITINDVHIPIKEAHGFLVPEQGFEGYLEYGDSHVWIYIGDIVVVLSR